MQSLPALVLAGLAVAGSAGAASRDVKYAPQPAWVKPPPAATATPAPDGAPVRFAYMDSQIRFDAGGQEDFVAYRVKVLRPEALAVGNLSLTWNPSTDDMIVHRVALIRDGKTIDVLGQAKFRVIERENNLENASLDGDLTATLQAPGVQVGDELEVALTIHRKDPTFSGKESGALLLPSAGALGAYRMSVQWPKSEPVRWKTSADLGAVAPSTEGDSRVLSVELRDPKSAIPTDGAPPRFNIRRLLEASEFESWADVAHSLSPLFDKAATLSPQSPIRAEAAKIAAASPDPKARAIAALRLVQDRVRYVFVGLDGGAYRPASADETWSRRYGDCKAKTVVLLALLKELGVPAEAVLVNSQGGDGMDQRLPSPQTFDHVVVRASIGGQRYWLDGTRLGDRRLDDLPPPVSRWGLALRSGATTLEPIKPQAPYLPSLSVVLDLDATAGFDKPAKVKEEYALRGDQVQVLRTQLAAASAEDAARAVKTFLHQEDSWIDFSSAAWRYDEAGGALIFTGTGESKLDWDGDAKAGHSYDVPGAGMSPPAEFKRPAEQDQAAPWLTEFPLFKRWTTVLHLPQAGAGRRWAYRALPMDVKMGGVAYWRSAELQDDTLRTTMSRRSYLPEFTAEQAKEVNAELPTFDNKISQVFESSAAAGSAQPDPAASKDATALAGTAARAMADHRLDDAQRLIEKALAINPTSPPALRAKFNLQLRRREFAGALATLDAVAAADRTQDLTAKRAGLLVVLGRKDEGTKAFDAIAASPRPDPADNFEAANDAANAGLKDRARAIVDAGLKAAPDSIELLQLKASYLVSDGDLENALRDIDAAIRVQPEGPANFLNRAVVLTRLGRLDEALAAADEAHRMDPLAQGITGTRVDILRRLGRKAEVAQAYEAWIAWDRTGGALNSRCWNRAIEASELDKAETDCAQAVKLAPNASAFWDSYGYVAFRSGRLDEALKRYDRAISLDATHAAPLYARGVVKLKKGDKAGGDADIAAARKLDPKVEAQLTDAGFKA